jgi:two-component system chemotaxis sensor kinase CheA
MPNPETEALFKERLDDLSMRMLIEEPSAEGQGGSEQLLSALAELARQAAEAGYGDAAGVFHDSSVCAPADAALSRREQLQAGLVRLQQALSNGASGATAKPGPVDSQTVFASSMGQDPELVADFVLESREHLTSIEQRILTLEREPANKDAINSIFRGFHSIKGLAGCLEFAAIQEIAHEVETALDLARDGKLAITAPVIDAILESVDYLTRAIAEVATGAGCRRLSGHDRVLAKVRAMREETPNVAPHPQSPGADPLAPNAASEAPRSTPQPNHDQAQAAPALPAGAPAESAPSGGPPPQQAFSVRVDTSKLDYLVEMVGEMVIAQSMIQHHESLTAVSDPRLHRDLTQLARITGEVQKTTMAIRMVPMGQLFQRTARQVRDLARKLGKQVELVTRGEETELDKSIAEKVSDPLMHMVRNAIDHGIELPAEREAAGKPAQAHLTLASYHEGGQIVIEVADDGRGLNAEKILAKAIQKGLVREGTQMAESEVFRLILEPGFSTAEQVTDVSGRGVGMDVVRRWVENLRGRIEIRSVPGGGTTFLLRLPLTMAIIDGLVVTVGSHRYVVPLFAVREMFRPVPEAIFTVQNRQEMVLVRGRLLPVLRLYKRFGIVPRSENPCEALLIVAETEAQSFCLMVDELIGKQEVVIKSLGEGLGKVPGLAGGAILGDGRVGLILDIGGLWGTHAGD